MAVKNKATKKATKKFVHKGPDVRRSVNDPPMNIFLSFTPKNQNAIPICWLQKGQALCAQKKKIPKPLGSAYFSASSLRVDSYLTNCINYDSMRNEW